MSFTLHSSRRAVLQNTNVSARSLTAQRKVPRARAKFPVGHARGFATEPGESIIFKSKFLADPKTVSVRLRVFRVPKTSSNELRCRSSAAPLGEVKHALTSSKDLQLNARHHDPQWRSGVYKFMDRNFPATETSQPHAGVEHGPMHLIKAGLIDQVAALGWQVNFGGHHQFGDITVENDPPRGIVKRPRLVSKVCENLARVVGEHVQRGHLPLTLGGDHSLVRSLIPGGILVLTHRDRPWERFWEPSASIQTRLSSGWTHMPISIRSYQHLLATSTACRSHS